MDITRTIYDICDEIFNLELQLKQGTNKREKGYFIRKNNFEEFKEYIHYKFLKKYFEDKRQTSHFASVKSIIKNNFEDQILKKTINPVKIKNSEELKKYLFSKDKKKYYLINKNLGEKIFEIKEEKDKEISFEIKNKNIIIYFNQNDIVKFKINNGIIEESSLIISKENLNNISTKDNNENRNECNDDKKG